MSIESDSQEAAPRRGAMSIETIYYQTHVTVNDTSIEAGLQTLKKHPSKNPATGVV